MVSGARKRTERLDLSIEAAFGADFAELARLAYRVAYRLLGRRSDTSRPPVGVMNTRSAGRPSYVCCGNPERDRWLAIVRHA